MRLGTDPEVFLLDQTGKHIAVNGLINADKWSPLQIPDMPEGFTLQEDNVALEYGIPPAACEDEFVTAIQSVMNKSKEWLNGLDFSKVACTIFTDDQLQHPLSRVFGCEPDYCAWTKLVNKKVTPKNNNLRSAGGHIHIETNQPILQVVVAMDKYLGVPSLFMDQDKDRRQLYGGPGAFRPKSYGVEYRTLSNFWIFEERYIRWVWRNTQRALENLTEDMDTDIRDAIQNHDLNLAQKLVDKYKLEVLWN